MSDLHLLSGGGLHDGRYTAGVELTMTPGSHTYWKQPGEAGVPPVFTFDASQNVASAVVSYPAPVRITEDGIEAYGYKDRVVFVVAVTPKDRDKPVRLHADVTYAVCNRICLPGHGDATLTLTPHGAAVGGEVLAAAQKQVPRQAERVPDLTIARVAGKANPTWTLGWTGAEPPQDIFPDAPDGFYFASKKTGPTRWTLTAEQSVTAPKASSTPVTLVLDRPDGATSITQTFDVGAAAK